MLSFSKHAGHVAGRRLYAKGGGGAYYDNLDKLYGVQMQQAQKQMGIADQYTYPAMGRMAALAQDYGSNANREKAAATAAADFAGAQRASDASLTEQMASMGVDPGSETFQRQLAKSHVAGAAADAAGRTGARNTVDNQAFARLQDFTSMGLGVSSNATSSLANAGQTASSVANGRMQNAMNNAAGVGSMVQGGINLYGLSQMADGGFVRLAEGGYVQKFAKGGVVQPIQPPAPPAGAPAGSSTAGQVAGPAGMGMAKYGKDAVTSLAQPSSMGLNPTVTNSAGQAANTAGNGINAQAVATQQVDKALGTGTDYALTSNAAPAAAEGLKVGAGAAESLGAAEGAAAAGAAGEGVAAASGAAGGMGAGMAALGTAMPWIGAGLVAGKALGLFADGGDVQPQGDITPGDHGFHGGEVDGPGGPKDDLVPALLSDGEFVMPIGAVKFFGLDRLEKMRQQGLQYEKQLGIQKPGAQQPQQGMH